MTTLMNYVMFMLFAAFIINHLHSVVMQHRLMSYLEEKHHERWCYLTSVPSLGIGPGGINGFRGVPYVFSVQDNEDPNVAELKHRVKLSIIRSICIFIAIPVAFFCVILISVALDLVRGK